LNEDNDNSLPGTHVRLTSNIINKSSNINTNIISSPFDNNKKTSNTIDLLSGLGDIFTNPINNNNTNLLNNNDNLINNTNTNNNSINLLNEVLSLSTNSFHEIKTPQKQNTLDNLGFLSNVTDVIILIKYNYSYILHRINRI
jgi:hypothetical protein